MAYAHALRRLGSVILRKRGKNRKPWRNSKEARRKKARKRARKANQSLTSA